MRPSELRRQERRSWLGFVAICLGSLLAVVLASLAAEQLGEPRWDPDTVQAGPDRELERPPPPRFVVRGLGETVRATAQTVQATLETERQVEIGGAVAFIPGGVRLAEVIVPLVPAGELLVLVVYRSESDDPERKRGRVVIDTYLRDGTTWQLLTGSLHQEEYELGGDNLLTAEGVTLRKAGPGVLAVDIPINRRCDPSVQSDLARRRSVYLEVDATPRVLLAHDSAGARGNRPEDRLEVFLAWTELEQGRGRGELTAVRRYPDEAFPESWSAPFASNDGAFELTEPPATLLARADRQATAAAREGKPDAARRLSRVIEALELVGSLDGSARYCVRMPHRVRPPDTLDRERWNDRLAERIFDLQLLLAEVLARQGQGMAALDVFGIDDPALVLASTPSRRAILDLLRGPRTSTLRILPEIQLATRPTFIGADARREHQVLPMRWIDSNHLILPRATEHHAAPAVLEAGPARAARTGAVVASALGSLYGSMTPAQPLPAHAQAVVTGALRAGLRHRLAALEARELAREAGADAARVAADMIGTRGIYTGERFPTLEVLTGRMDAETPWPRLQVYAPLIGPYDLSPSGSRLLVDQGLTCAGGFVQLCIGRPELCRDGAPPPAFGPSRSAGPDPSTTSLYALPETRVAPCYPSEVPSELPEGPAFVGWLDDERLVLRDGTDFLELGIALDGTVTRASAVEPDYPIVAAETDGEADGDDAAPGLGAVLPRLFGAGVAGSRPWPWLPANPGVAARFEIALDEHAMWLHDRDSDRDYLLQLWSQMPFGAPSGAWTATISPDGRYVAVWTQEHGLWIGTLSDLPQ